MPGNPRAIITEAERQFPVRVKVALPRDGFGRRLTAMHAWLDESCGADSWSSAPAGSHGVVNDAVAFYFRDATLAAAFVARFCAGSPTKIENGAYEPRSDVPLRSSEIPNRGWNATNREP
jgi:hypothetical protein